jgi:Xaa-Pro aminopeptidase
MDVLPSAFFRTYQKLFPDTLMVDISPLIRSGRMIKSAYEISCITRAAEIADSMYEKIPAFLETADREIDLAAKVEAFYRTMGHSGLVRTRGFNMECHYGQIMSGKRGAVPSNSPGPTGGEGPGPFCSQGAGKGKIEMNEPIFVDYASNVGGYIADQARIFSRGVLDNKFHMAHEVMLEIQNSVVDKAQPGVRAKDLYDLAWKIAQRAGLEVGFMGYPDAVPFVAHGVGLDIDEWPIIGRNSKTVLEEGMVIALEPKFVFPGEGVVGIENTFAVTANGMKKLNRFPDAICTC